MNEDFDEVFRKQFQGNTNSEKKEVVEKKETAQPRPTTPAAQPAAAPVAKPVEKKTGDARRERIRSKFFGSVVNKKEIKKERKHGLFASIMIGLANILIIVGIVVLIRTFLVSPFAVVGSSMEGNLHNGNLILVDKISYRVGNPKRGDVVVFYPPVERKSNQAGVVCTAKKLGHLILRKDIETACNTREFYVKRVVGVEGDQVELKNRQVFVTPAGTTDRLLLQEDFLLPKNQENTCFTPSCNSNKDINGVLLTIPEDTVYVLGDNRTGSSDSRAWKKDGKDIPFVPEANISGKVRAVFWGPSDMGLVPKIDILEEK